MMWPPLPRWRYFSAAAMQGRKSTYKLCLQTVMCYVIIVEMHSHCAWGAALRYASNMVNYSSSPAGISSQQAMKSSAKPYLNGNSCEICFISICFQPFDCHFISVGPLSCPVLCSLSSCLVLFCVLCGRVLSCTVFFVVVSGHIYLLQTQQSITS